MSRIKILNVEYDKRELNKDQGLLNFFFEYVIDYGKSAKLQFNGLVLYMDSKDFTKKIINDWEKDRKIVATLSTEIFNTILFKCNIKALQLADDLGLPAHFKIPLIRQKPEDIVEKSQKKEELKKAS